MDSMSERQNTSPESHARSPKRTPLPKVQMAIVMLIQAAEPITATVIYPFINQFVHETGITRGDERRTGYYAGVIESVFFFTEALTVFHWGWLSDRIGRRPILLLGPLGLCFAMLGFGLSRTFWSMVVYRSLQGVFNGNIGVSKTVMAEFTDATNIADAYAMMPLMWSFSLTVGPIMGGVFARPASRWPETLGRIPFFHQYPYFLPCALAAILAIVSFIFAFLGLKETLPSAVAQQKLKEQDKLSVTESVTETTALNSPRDVAGYGANGHTRSHSADSVTTLVNQSAHTQPPPPFRALLIPRVMIPLSNHLFLTFTDMSFQVLRPLVFSTSIQNGGLGFTPYEIGITMGIWGIVNAFLQLNFLARSIRKFGPRTMYIVGHASFAIGIALYPLLSYLAARAGRVDAAVWAVVVLQLGISTMSFVAYGALQIIIVDSAPSRSSLGATNGLTQAGGCVTRSLAPTVASSLFSISLEHHLAGGNMVYLILLAISFIGIYLSFLLPKRLYSQE